MLAPTSKRGFLAILALAIYFVASSARAELYNCDGLWSNKPCENGTALNVIEEKQNQNQPKEEKKPLVEQAVEDSESSKQPPAGLPQCRERIIRERLPSPVPRLEVLSESLYDSNRKRFRVRVFGKGKIYIATKITWLAGDMNPKTYEKKGPRFPVAIPSDSNSVDEDISVKLPVTAKQWNVELFVENASRYYESVSRQFEVDTDSAIRYLRRQYNPQTCKPQNTAWLTKMEYYPAAGQRFMVLGIGDSLHLFRGISPELWNELCNSSSTGELYEIKIKDAYHYCTG